MQVLSPIPVTFCYQAETRGAQDLAAAQNDFFARIVTEHPSRFAALGAVPLQDPDLAVAELRRCMVRPGFLGVEIATRVCGAELDDERLDRFFAVAHELNALVLVHPSDQDLLARTTDKGVGFGAGMPIETALAGIALITGTALSRRPQVRLCLAHGAGVLPALIGRLDKGALIAGTSHDSATLPSRLAAGLWCDSLTYDHLALSAAVSLFGPDHVVFGTDYPFPAMPHPLGDALNNLPHDLRDRIGHKNIEEQYGALSRPGTHPLPAAGGH